MRLGIGFAIGSGLFVDVLNSIIATDQWIQGKPTSFISFH